MVDFVKNIQQAIQFNAQLVIIAKEETAIAMSIKYHAVLEDTLNMLEREQIILVARVVHREIIVHPEQLLQLYVQ